MLMMEKNEKKMPTFESHDEAKEWFKGEYGSLFILDSFKLEEGKKVMVYHLVLNKSDYIKSLDKMENNKVIAGFDFLNSYQTVKIHEDGQVNISY